MGNTLVGNNLSEPMCRLKKVMRRMNHGRIAGLLILGGEPILDRGTHVEQTIKMGGANAPIRGPVEKEKYKIYFAEFCHALKHVQDGSRITVEVKHGEPFVMRKEMAA